MDKKNYNENEAGYHTDTRLKSDPILRFGYLATLIEIETEIAGTKAEIETDLKYGRVKKRLDKQIKLSKMLIMQSK
jgi:hypothetical protein